MKTKEFKVATVSNNANAFGLRGMIVVARDGEAWELAASYLNVLPMNTIFTVNLDKRNNPIWNDYECPTLMKRPPASVIAEIWDEKAVPLSPKEPENNTIYDKTYTLKSPLHHLKCWNFTDGSTASFRIGDKIKVECVNDATTTVISCISSGGRKTSNGSQGYRFIVNNLALAKAIGVDIPERTEDIVGDIIALENGTASPETAKRILSSPLGKTLYGSNA